MTPKITAADMSEKMKLLPCPFCGGFDFEVQRFGVSKWAVRCLNWDCWAQGPYYKTEASAISAWNQRKEGEG